MPLDVHKWKREYTTLDDGTELAAWWPEEYTELPEPTYDYDLPIGPVNVCQRCGRCHVVGDTLYVWCEDIGGDDE